MPKPIAETPVAERIIVALDVSSEAEGALLIDALPQARFFKIGLEAITAGITERLIAYVMERGAQVFWDGKFHDIENTVVGAINALPKNVVFFTLHASCARNTMCAAAAAANDGGHQAFAVTVLTDKTHADLTDLGLATAYVDPHSQGFDPTKVELYKHQDMQGLVLRLAKLAHESGVHGVICSPKELPILRHAFPPESGFQLITPGIRPTWAAANDQKRIMTPFDAFRLGADRIVIGRPLTSPPTGMLPSAAFDRVLEEAERGIAEHAQQNAA